jgi:hypothetical protein
MKIWVGHGSEHSARLILVGQFRDAERARLTEERIKALVELAIKQPEPNWEQSEEWYDEPTREALNGLRLWQLGPSDLGNFRYDHGVSREEDRIEISTDEYEIQGLIKVLVLAGARIEIYSRSEWNDDGSPVEEPEVGEDSDGEGAPAESDAGTATRDEPEASSAPGEFEDAAADQQEADSAS